MTQPDTAARILDAARACLLEVGYAALATRKVADKAGVPLSQIHYHFGSKEELILSLLRRENDRLLGRQAAMFRDDLPLWKRWELACDYFDDDIGSGYVRVLQEMTAAGWSSEAVGKEMQAVYEGWVELLTGVAREAERRGWGLGGLSAEELAALVAASFIGAESMVLIGMESERFPIRAALRNIGQVIMAVEGSGGK